MQKIIWELTRQQFEAYTRANFDELTGLLRGNVFDGRVAKLAETSIGKKGGALVYIDLNDIKAMNAKYGHEQVNILLAEIGRVIDKSIRPYDSACRRGGDEFVICLSNLQKEDAGVNAVHRIFREIENINIEMKTAKGEVISIRPSLSMGVRAIKEEEMKTIGENLKSWIDETDAGVTALKHRQGHSKEGICIINQDGTSGSIHEYNATDKGFRVAEDVKLEEAANPEAVLEKTIRRALTLIVEPCIRKETGLAPAPIEETIKKLANDIRTNCY